ncbi:cupredoxin domain-containing protein [Aliamphritea spongicola]
MGSYPKGNQRSVVAEKPGTLTVECAIHPNMQMTIHVEE